MYDPDDLIVQGMPAWSFPTTGTPTTFISYSKPGTQLCYSNTPGSLTICDVNDGTTKRVFLQPYTQHPLMGAHFHPVEDDYIICVFKDGYMFVYDIEAGEPIKMGRHLGSNIITSDMDPFGEMYAIACADGSIRIYDIETLTRTNALVKMTGRNAASQASTIYDLKFHSEDSNYILSAVGSDRIFFWDLRTGNAEKSIVGPHIRGPGLAMYDNKILTGSSRELKSLELWDFGTCKKIGDISGQPNVNCVAMSRVGLNLCCASTATNTAYVYGMEKLQLIGQSPPHRASPSTIAVSPHGTSFAVGSDQGEITCMMVRVRD